MKKKALIFGALFAVLSLCSMIARGQGDAVVNVYNWSDYMDSSILKAFEKETGIKVVYSVFDSNEALHAKLLTGHTGYDVVVPTADWMARQIKAGIYQKLDKTKLPNIQYQWDFITKRVAIYDPNNAYSVNYMWGTTGIGYVGGKIKARLGKLPDNSLSLIFDKKIVSKLADCGVQMIDAPNDVVASVLVYLGRDPNSQKKEDIDAAFALLKQIRPYIQKFTSSEYIEALANGDICLAVGYSGDIYQARNRAREAKRSVDVRYMIPKQGAFLWFDQMAIPKDAPHLENAYKFINYMMRPEVIAKASNFLFYANGNKASQKFLNKAILNDKGIYPDDKTLKHLYALKPLPLRAQRALVRRWARLKAGD